MLYDSTYMRFTETESGMVAARAWEGAHGALVSVGSGFQFGHMEKFWRRMVVMIMQHCEHT